MWLLGSGLGEAGRQGETERLGEAEEAGVKDTSVSIVGVVPACGQSGHSVTAMTPEPHRPGAPADCGHLLRR